MRVLGLDPSMSNFGWAIHDSDAVGAPRCLDRGRFQTPPSTLFIDRYIGLRESLRSLVEKMGASYGVTRVGLESPVFGELWSEGMYGLYLYVCEALRLAQVDVVLFTPMQIKAHARRFLERPPNWKMMKPDMVEASKEDSGGKGRWNHNEADAYWAARVASRFWLLHDGVMGVSELDDIEQKHFTEIHKFTRGKKAGDTVFKGILHREDDRFFRWSQEGLDGEEGK